MTKFIEKAEIKRKILNTKTEAELDEVYNKISGDARSKKDTLISQAREDCVNKKIGIGNFERAIKYHEKECEDILDAAQKYYYQKEERLFKQQQMKGSN